MIDKYNKMPAKYKDMLNRAVLLADYLHTQAIDIGKFLLGHNGDDIRSCINILKYAHSIHDAEILTEIRSLTETLDDNNQFDGLEKIKTYLDFVLAAQEICKRVRQCGQELQESMLERYKPEDLINKFNDLEIPCNQKK